MTPSNSDNIWQWQAPGTAWKGVGLYHITLTIPSREPLLGTLLIPDNDPTPEPQFFFQRWTIFER